MWIYNEQIYDETPDDYQGFVYVITELDTDKKYIGKRTSGGLKYYQKIVKELEGYEPKPNPTGETIMDQIRKFRFSLSPKGKVITKERS